MIDDHAVRHGDVHPSVQQRLQQIAGQVQRYGQRPRMGVPVADRLRRQPDAERGHHIVEEAVEMVGRELDDHVRRKIADRLGQPREACSHGCLGHVVGDSLVQEGCVRRAYRPKVRQVF